MTYLLMIKVWNQAAGINTNQAQRDAANLLTDRQWHYVNHILNPDRNWELLDDIFNH